LASALEKISGTKIEMKSSNDVTAPMFIALPFKKKKKVSAGLHSTHPPIAERIRILRAMGGTGYMAYQEAYAEVKGKKSTIIPGSGLADTENPGIRMAFDEPSDKRSVKRNAGDIMMAVNNYRFIDCTCGLRIKIPPDYRKESISCPKCGTTHTL
jgi:heat shock protein HtpX